MCDYSLQGLPNRLAAEGEELVAHRFPTTTIGFTSPQELQAIAQARANQKRSGFWSAIKGWFIIETKPPATAVCIPPGARLSLQDIPERLQREFDVGPNEEVTFTQLTAQPYTFGRSYLAKFNKLTVKPSDTMLAEVISAKRRLQTEPFRSDGDEKTVVDVRLSYYPPAGAVGHAIASLFGADPKSEMDDDLMRMKSFIETGHQPHDAYERQMRGASVH